MRNGALLAAVTGLAAGCVINSDKWPRPRDLTPDWSVERTRILAIRSDPAEALPGDVVTFDALFGAPPDAPLDLTVVWLACPVLDEAATVGCLTDLGGIDLENADPEDLAELGLIGIQTWQGDEVTGFPPTYVVPDTLLDDLPPEDRAEGAYVLVQLLAFPTEMLDDGPEAFEQLDFSVVISAFKRVVVSEASTPNHNPEIGVFTVDGLPIPPGTPVTVEAGQAYELGAALPEGAIERYDYVTSDGTVEGRIEEPYFSWYTTGGEMLEEVTLWPYVEASWIAPEASVERGVWYNVLRDRRGGMAWYTQEFVVARP